MMRTWVTVISQPTLFPLALISLYTSHTGQFLGNFRERCMNVLMPAFAKGSFDHLTVPMSPKFLLSERNLGRFVSVWTIGNGISLPSRMHFLYPTSMRHYKQCTIVMSSLLLTWCKDTCSWLWQKMTSRRLHLEQVLQACTSLLVCLLACQMLGQASAG